MCPAWPQSPDLRHGELTLPSSPPTPSPLAGLTQEPRGARARLYSTWLAWVHSELGGNGPIMSLRMVHFFGCRRGMWGVLGHYVLKHDLKAGCGCVGALPEGANSGALHSFREAPGGPSAHGLQQKGLPAGFLFPSLSSRLLLCFQGPPAPASCLQPALGGDLAKTEGCWRITLTCGGVEETDSVHVILVGAGRLGGFLAVASFEQNLKTTEMGKSGQSSGLLRPPPRPPPLPNGP